MSEYYQHYLIPLQHDFSPDSIVFAQFLGQLINAGYVSENHSITVSPILKSERSTREMTNPFTGESIAVKMPSRQARAPQPLANLMQLPDLTNSDFEYDVAISCDEAPPKPPLEVGYIDDGSWKLMENSYYSEIKCRVRKHVVRLSQLRSIDDLHHPIDLANPPSPIFDEDCGIDESNGLFVHPELGAITIPEAGCAMFWLEFNFGKFIYPQARTEDVNLLDQSLVELAERVFAIRFVQACHWG